MNTTADQDATTFLKKARTLRPLPALPASIPTPEVDYTLSSVGSVITQITVNGDMRTFQSGHFTEPTTNAWTAPFMAGLTRAEKDAFLAWGYAVHERLVASVAEFFRNMSQVREVRDEILSGVTE